MKQLEDMPVPTKKDPKAKKTDKKAPKAPAPKKEKKKRKKGWLILLLLLLLLLGGGGAYYYFYMYNPAGNTAKFKGDLQQDRSNIGPFTYSLDLLEYDQNDRFILKNDLLNYMNEYITEFLAQKGYASSKQSMMDRVGRYTEGRLEELLDNRGYFVERIIPNEDYVHNFLNNDLKSKKGRRANTTIQTELMNGELDNLLNTLIDELGLRSAAPVAKAEVKKEESKPAPQLAKQSKKGYDLVAGFYTNRNSAISMQNRLKSMGCAAYVIEKNSGYYVSMGSAATQTAAEGILKQVKSWYDGDVIIKKID